MGVPSFKVFSKARDEWFFWAANCIDAPGGGGEQSIVDIKKGGGK